MTGAGAAALRRDIRRALSSQATLRRAILLGEILGPPRALQVSDERGQAEQQAHLSSSGADGAPNGRQGYTSAAPQPMNGHASGHTNGHANGHANGHVQTTDADAPLVTERPLVTEAPLRPAEAAAGQPERAVGPSPADRASPQVARSVPAPARRSLARDILSVSLRAITHTLRRVVQ